MTVLDLRKRFGSTLAVFVKALSRLGEIAYKTVHLSSINAQHELYINTFEDFKWILCELKEMFTIFGQNTACFGEISFLYDNKDILQRYQGQLQNLHDGEAWHPGQEGVGAGLAHRPSNKLIVSLI